MGSERPSTILRLPSRESAQEKGRRYLVEGRMLLRLVTAERVDAVCKGSGAFYAQRWESGRWTCDCPAAGECAHLVALKLVVAR